MEFLDQIWAYIAPVYAWLYAGAAAYAGDGTTVNLMMFGIQVGVIALVMALLMQSYGAILIFTVVGVIVHIIVDQVLPMVRDGASFSMPPFMEMSYWQYGAALALCYFLAITILSIVKGLVFRGD